MNEKTEGFNVFSAVSVKRKRPRPVFELGAPIPFSWDDNQSTKLIGVYKCKYLNVYAYKR